MEKVHKDAATFQQEVSTNFQKALKTFEGLIEAGSKAKPKPAPQKTPPPTKSNVVVNTPTPATSEPNVIDLVITVPDDYDMPTTSRIRAVTTTQPPHPSEKGKEKAIPMAYIETISTSESVENEDSIMER